MLVVQIDDWEARRLVDFLWDLFHSEYRVPENPSGIADHRKWPGKIGSDAVQALQFSCSAIGFC